MTLAGLPTPLVVPPVNPPVLATLLRLPAVADGVMIEFEPGQGAGEPAGAQAIVVLWART